MDELLKALVGLVNTGGDLANDALYLYFALQALSTFSIAGPIVTIAYLGYRLVMHDLNDRKAIKKQRELEIIGDIVKHCNGKPPRVIYGYGTDGVGQSYIMSPALLCSYGFELEKSS